MPDQTVILARIYRAGARDLARLLQGTDFQRGKAARLLGQVDRITRRMTGRAVQWATRASRQAYRQGLAESDAMLAAISRQLGDGADLDFSRFNRINTRAADVFALQIARDLAAATDRLGDQARRVIAATQQRILRDPELAEHVAKGLISGGSIGRVGRGLRAALTEAGKKALDEGRITAAELEDMRKVRGGTITAGKRTMSIVRYCRMVAGYQLRQAVTAATKDRLAEAGEQLGDPDAFDLVTITGPISGDWCDFYVGKVFSISGRSGEFPALRSIPNGGPPFHPNCTHNVAPFVRELSTAKEVERGRINSSLLGIDARQATRMYGGIDRRLAARRAQAPPGGRSSVAVPHGSDP